MSCKRKTFSIEEKAKIIKKIESGCSQAVICREYCLQKSTVGTIWKNRDSIIRAYECNEAKVKKLRKPVREDVDAALLKWFALQRSLNITVTGPLLQAKAEEFAKLFDCGEFLCSSGWLDRFKKRHSITFGTTSGEAAHVDVSSTTEWLEKVWPEVRIQYSDHNIFNADETGLFFKMTPNKTLKFKGEKCVGGKQAKDRITVLVCANMTGSEKRKLLVIGKFANPHCFKNVKHLPVCYKANKRAWMTSAIFEEELRRWDKELHHQNRKILLIVDNCPSHPTLSNLGNIKLVFLPANTTSVLQPMDQGVIRSLKSYYRKSVLLHMINCMDRKVEFSVNLHDGIRLIAKAWKCVTKETIRNCFRHSGLLSEPPSAEVEDEEDNLPLSVWLKQNNVVQQFSDCEDIDSYVNVDSDLLTSEVPDEADIVASVASIVNETENVDSDDCAEEPIPSPSDALEAIKTVARLFEYHGVNSAVLDAVFTVENAVEKICLKKCTHQQQITDFFF